MGVRKGKFIVLEGIDGCGKSVQIAYLQDYLKNEVDLEVVLCRELGSVPLAENIRDILKNKSYKICDITELFLFQAARAQFVEEFLKPNLDNGFIIVSDRYYHSTIAYQGYGRGLDLSLIHRLNKVSTNGLKPDLTIILDVPVDVALERMSKQQRDRIELEESDFWERVREGYIRLRDGLSDEKIYVIDGERNMNEIFEDIKGHVDSLLKK